MTGITETIETKTKTKTIQDPIYMAETEKINNIVTDVAVIKTEIKHLVTGHAELLSTMKNMSVVPMEAFLQAKKDAEREHKAIYKAIEEGDKDVRTDLDKLMAWKDTVITKIALGAIIFLILIVLGIAGLSQYSPV